MGIDDLIDDEKESEKKSKSEDIASDLGIESSEELEQLDTRISRLYESLMNNDSRIESLEDDVRVIMGSLSKVIQEMDYDGEDGIDENSDKSNKNQNGFEW